jgi:hypothetical protein
MEASNGATIGLPVKSMQLARSGNNLRGLEILSLIND